MADTIIIDELLCFITNKLDIVPCDDLVTLCTKTFDETTIRESKLTLFNACHRGPEHEAPPDGIKYRKCKGSNSAENNIKDVITLFQELGADAPKFAAVNLNILPDMTDVDRLYALVSRLKTDVTGLAGMVKMQNVEIAALKGIVINKVNTTQVPTYADSMKTVATVPVAKPPLRRSSSVDPEIVPPERSGPRDKGPAEGNLQEQINGPWIVNGGRRRRRRQQMKAGTSASNTTNSSRVVGIKRVKTAEVFVTRLSPECQADDVQNFILVNLYLQATVRKITNTRNATQFSSFHISCACNDPRVFFDEKLWPEHVLYRRWYPPKRTPRPLEGDINNTHGL